jgi:hypothetical protein
MTLLEALSALVILGTTTVGFLEVFHTTARVTRAATEWTRITEYAEFVMEERLAHAPQDGRLEPPAGVSARLDERSWAPGITEVTVVVTSADGQRLELRRLTRNDERDAPGAPR